VVVDGSGAVLGPVVTIPSNSDGLSVSSTRVVFSYRQGNDFTLLQTQGGTEVIPGALPTNYSVYPARVFYADNSCGGQPVGFVFPAGLAPQVIPLRIIVGTEIWSVDETGIAEISAGSYRSAGSATAGCTPIATDTYSLWPSDGLWGSFSFTPPLRVTLNPSIFWDQFQTGDATRWSNY